VRVGELLRSEVVDVDGRSLGRVHDVRLVQDGPVLGAWGPALRLDGLVVGRGSVAIRLGFHRHSVRGPLLLRLLFRALEGRARYVAWGQVAERAPGRLVLAGRASDLGSIGDAR
jgi:hypothetical protein